MAYNVIKTLVIGLGSTGTEICDAIAGRIKWELGDLAKAPWVRFLCIETDGNTLCDHVTQDDFRSLEISGADYDQVLSNPDIYDPLIDYKAWADEETLKRLPGNAVTTGAGNIRMVGRLSFFFPPNYGGSKVALTERLQSLRQLTAAQATEQRGPLVDGDDPDIEFGANGQVRIIVVGTLCGGTCSGLAADFGYFVKSNTRQGELTLSFFTIPNHRLTSTIDPAANKYKRNAYHALVELNHYHLAGRPEERRIKFSDGILGNEQLNIQPYDGAYLVRADGVGNEYTEALSRALADRIFLNIFAPETDPFAHLVNTAPFDRENRAHAFCAFGLYTVEFPALQVMEACSKRLLAYTLREWSMHEFPEEQVDQRLDEIGLTWKALQEILLIQSDGQNLRGVAEALLSDVVNQAATAPAGATSSLVRLRELFNPDGPVERAIRQNRDRVATAIETKIRAYVSTHLLKYREGPLHLVQLLRKAQERVRAFSEHTHTPDYASAEMVNGLLDHVQAYHHSPLLGITGLREQAITQLIPQLREALETEVHTCFTDIVFCMLHPAAETLGENVNPLKQVEQRIAPIQRRVSHLCDVVRMLASALQKRADELATTQPQINGLCLFEPETAAGGTVPVEYNRCLVEEAGDGGATTWESMRERMATLIIQEWDRLLDLIVPIHGDAPNWLQDSTRLLAKKQHIPAPDLQRMLDVALRPFRRLAAVDVLERWQMHATHEQEARQAGRNAGAFLDLNLELAQHGGRSPVESHTFLLLPSGSLRDEFASIVLAGMPNLDVEQAESPDKFRMVFLREWFRFPLSGVPSILGNGGLHAAECSDFPTFYTRKDVAWTGLSDAEIEAVRRAEELIAVGVLLKIIEPKQGALVIPWGRSGFGDSGERRLSLNLFTAIQQLAREEGDIDRHLIAGARDRLAQKISFQRQECGNDRSFIQRFVQALDDGIGGVIPGWNVDVISEFLTRYCSRDDALFQAYVEEFPPEPEVISPLRQPNGSFKCSECGGDIGTDERDAARNGWRCHVNPDHYFGVVARQTGNSR